MALDQALVACAIAVVYSVWIIRYGALRLAAVVRSAARPLLCALGMAAVVLLADLIPAFHDIPAWASLLTLGSLSLAVFLAASQVAMPNLLRSGWAAVRGRPEGPVTDTDAPQQG